MAENSSHDSEERLATRKRAESNVARAHGESLWQSAIEGLGYAPALLRDPNLMKRGNGETRAQALQFAQHTHGNRAVQRYLQANLSNQANAVSVQRFPWVGPLGPLAGSQGANMLGGLYGAASGALGWLGDMILGKPKTFDDLASGEINTKNAPEKFTLPKEMQEGMTKAWEGSFPGGKSQEQGGILVKDDKGGYKWKAGKPLDEGSSGAFLPNRVDLDKGETLVGTGHTHPYDKSEGGHTNVSFSGGDLANMIDYSENFKVVQSGKGQFAAAKTKEFTDKVKGLDDKGKEKMYGDMTKKYDDAFKKAKGTIAEKSAAAAKAVSDEYGLAYYEGSGGELARK